MQNSNDCATRFLEARKCREVHPERSTHEEKTGEAIRDKGATESSDREVSKTD